MCDINAITTTSPIKFKEDWVGGELYNKQQEFIFRTKIENNKPTVNIYAIIRTAFTQYMIVLRTKVSTDKPSGSIIIEGPESQFMNILNKSAYDNMAIVVDD